MKSLKRELKHEASTGKISGETKATTTDQAKKGGRHLLQVVEVKPGLHEIAEGIINQPVYSISSPRESAHLFGLWPRNGKGSGRFIKLASEKIKMPGEAKQRYRQAANDPPTDETAVFLSTHLGSSKVKIVLASRNKGHWLELYSGTALWKELGISRLDIASF